MLGTFEPFIPWDEVRKRIKCSDAIWSKIRKANPDHRGIKAGRILRGYYPSRTRSLSSRIDMDVIGPKEFIKRFGRVAYRNIPADAFIRRGHRKGITGEYILRAGL